MTRSISCLGCAAVAFMLFIVRPAAAQISDDASTTNVLNDIQWQQIDEAVEQGLTWLAKQQQRDGSFPTMPQGQPGVTSLCVMAFMGHGHLPGEGPYGEQLRKAVDYVIACQKRNGMLALVAPNGAIVSRNVRHEIGYTMPYNHAIAGLLLSESYAIEGAQRANEMRPVIRKALDVTLEMHNWPKDRAADKGGWRYLDDLDSEDSDLSVTGWQLMFLRSAKNAGFDVPSKPIDRAVGYVRRCFRQDSGGFTYMITQPDRTSRGMAGAGILALAHSGLHNTPEAKSAADWILQNGFGTSNDSGRHREDRYHYGLLTCCQAMYQLGGQHWAQFFPPTAAAIVTNQRPDGSWPKESHQGDARFGNAYTTAICLIALGAPNQLLPIFQR